MKDELRSVMNGAGFLIDDLWVSKDTLPDRTSIQWINVIAHKRIESVASREAIRKVKSMHRASTPSIQVET